MISTSLLAAAASLLPLAAASDPIVEPQWLRDRLGNPGLVIVEVSWSQGKPAGEYLQGHIPGAVHLDTDRLENGSPRWQLRPLEELQRVIGSLGIGPKGTVVVYGSQTIAAARAWWVLHYAGVRDVRLLSGGYQAWLRVGFPGEPGEIRPSPVTFTARARRESLATVEDVKRAGGRAIRADVRSRDEFEGKVSGYDYLDRKGRLPGAVNLGNADDSARIYQNADGTLRPPGEIAALWRGQGVDAGREVIFYCGGGWRSSLAYLYAHALGWRRIRNFSAGWAGWSTIYEKSGDGAWRQLPAANPVE